MIEVTNDFIAITRGDDGVIDVSIVQDGGVPYTMQEGDKLELTVRALPTPDSPILIHKTSESGKPVIALSSADTDIEAGSYSADIQLTMADGCVCTVWPTSLIRHISPRNLNNFRIAAGVSA